MGKLERYLSTEQLTIQQIMGEVSWNHKKTNQLPKLAILTEPKTPIVQLSDSKFSIFHQPEHIFHTLEENLCSSKI